VLCQELGSFETELSMVKEFFLEGDLSSEPQVSRSSDKSWILNEVGICLMSLGRLSEANQFFERKIKMQIEIEDWSNAGRGYQNLADMYSFLGEPVDSNIAADMALDLARRGEDNYGERDSLTNRGWAAHLLGDLANASEDYRQAELLEREIDPDKPFLYGLRGIQYADHLWRIGDAECARKVTITNIELCERNRWLNDLGRCHRVLGNLDADKGNHDDARKNYDEALRIVRGVQLRDVLIEALLARGRWYGKYMHDAEAAFSDLNEALEYAVDGGYRIYEADIRIGLAWAHAADDNIKSASEQAQRALQMSEEMGYHWGKMDAKEVLEKIKKAK
jgi:tetratricopeptide (TPR) repeat protein